MTATSARLRVLGEDSGFFSLKTMGITMAAILAAGAAASGDMQRLSRRIFGGNDNVVSTAPAPAETPTFTAVLSPVSATKAPPSWVTTNPPPTMSRRLDFSKQTGAVDKTPMASAQQASSQTAPVAATAASSSAVAASTHSQSVHSQYNFTDCVSEAAVPTNVPRNEYVTHPGHGTPEDKAVTHIHKAFVVPIEYLRPLWEETTEHAKMTQLFDAAARAGQGCFMNGPEHFDVNGKLKDYYPNGKQNLVLSSELWLASADGKLNAYAGQRERIWQTIRYALNHPEGNPGKKVNFTVAIDNTSKAGLWAGGIDQFTYRADSKGNVMPVTEMPLVEFH